VDTDWKKEADWCREAIIDVISRGTRLRTAVVVVRR